MQCKDIPDEDYLEAVRTASRLNGGLRAFYWDVGCVLAGHPDHVTNRSAHAAGSYNDCLPTNLVIAKARKLIDKGKMGGCPCGCRGDFEVLDAEGLPEERLGAAPIFAASVHVGPVGASEPSGFPALGPEWKELGWTTEGVAFAHERDELPSIQSWVPPRAATVSFAMDYEAFRAAFDGMRQAMTSFGEAAGKLSVLFRPFRRAGRTRRVSAMRSAYRAKKGRRW